MKRKQKTFKQQGTRLLIAKVITENPIMAVVTETSKEWQFNYLVEHLIEEREWYRSMQGGKA